MIRIRFPVHLSIKFINQELNYPNFVLYFFGKLSGLNSLKSSLESNGVRCTGVNNIALNDINAFRAVRCEVVAERNKKTFEYLDNYFLSDWRMKNRFNCDLFRLHLSNRLPADWSTLDYWKWHASLDKSGINKRPSKWIERKISSTLHLCESIKKQGFKDKPLFNLPWVLHKPLIKTRYNINHAINGFEVLDGHHRVAIMIALNYKNIKVLMVEDIAMKTPFGIPLNEIKD